MAVGDTPITLVGNLTADPELRFTPSGAAVANFTVASTPRRYNSQTNQWDDGETMYLQCNVWRNAAEYVSDSLTKGMRVIVTGRLRQRSFETSNGDRRRVFEVEVDEVGPSLRYARAQVERVSFNGGNSGNRGSGAGYNSGNFGGNQPSQQGGGYQQSNSRDNSQSDPWNTAPQQGGFEGANDDPPF